MTTSLHQQLCANAWYATLPEDFQQFILNMHKTVQLEKGQVLFFRGDVDDGMYAILNGAIQLGFSDAEGRESLMLIAEANLWFGEISLIDGKPRTHDAIALQSTTLMHLPKAILLDFLHLHPDYWRHIALLLSQKIRPLLLEIEVLQHGSLTQRLARRLLMILHSYDDRNAIQNRQIELSQERLALMLSLSRQRINGLLHELEDAQIIKREFKSIHILDIERLKQLAEASTETNDE
ncbi:cAMP-binding domain of CRP or a regulatory subunit of cAMP-dependent protein kinases [Acinetobacter marinus]|uniref:cAMP-binding domain of CRP or a regulatory subunit of cAMP-dependent protein kinases n=1 Tax=Acinetobacter marinus TaxID=281375 RepID=A0A1G6MI16_9GAMM|nr:Crp/Fnr family transcriptional regulator [Acinetobacter marinus]SDC55258.1 cAMP-binding domain of CRP or a regulatory subunit of cAMP-dependent protein kinases [Acinetobacter marinus]